MEFSRSLLEAVKSSDGRGFEMALWREMSDDIEFEFLERVVVVLKMFRLRLKKHLQR